MKRLLFFLRSKLFVKMKYQMALFIIVSTIIPIFCVQSINYSLTSSFISKKNSAILNDNLILSKNNANNVIAEYRKLLYQISTDDRFIANLSLFNESQPETKRFANCKEAISNRIYTLCLMHPEVRGVGVTNTNGQSVLADQGLKKNQHLAGFFTKFGGSLNQKSVNQLDPFLEIIKPDNEFYDENDPVFFISYRIFDLETMKILGSVVMFIEISKLNEAINNESNATSEFSNKLIITQDNQVLCSNENKNVGIFANNIPGYGEFSFSSKNRQTEYKDKNSLVIMTDFDNFGLKLVDVVDNNKLFGEVHHLWLYSFGLIFIVMILTLFVSYVFSRHLVRSIERMSLAMNEFKKDNLNISISEQSNNEIRLVETAFNSMVKRIRKLIYENKQQFDHIVEITNETNKAELKSLELQINPHFLFNTIDTINWMAIREGCCDISNQLNNLAYILRYTVYNMNGVVDFQKEVEWMERYLELQQNRFPHRFDYKVTIDAASAECFTHKLLLQPFLENSIIHGFEKIQYKGHIEVTINMLAHKYIVIKIWDNGSGMSRDKIKQVNRMFYSRNEKYDFGIGLQNIAYRIYRYYNGKAKVYASTDGKLTCFTLFIPTNI